MFTTGLLPANDNPVADAIFFFTSLINTNVDIIGILFNVTNIIVFIKSKSSESMNVTLLGLAVSDLGCLFCNLLYSAFISPFFIHNEIPVEPVELMVVVAALPRWYFSRISTCLALFTSFERCLCVTMPLKVKTVITKARAQAFAASCFVLTFVLFLPLFVSARLNWKFSEVRNRTLVGKVQRSDFTHVLAVMSVINSAITFSSFALLVLLTIVLVMRLNQKSKWRQDHSSTGKECSFVSRDKKLVKMIVIIDVVLIICNLPTIILDILIPIIPGFTIYGQLQSIYLACWNAAFLFESTNASVNIFVYYNMSSRFKAELQKLFPFLVKNQKESS